MSIAKIKKGDFVIITAGRDKGKKGEVLAIKEVTKPNGKVQKKVVVQGVALCSKHVKPNPNIDEQGGIKKIEAAIDVSNVPLYDQSLNQTIKVGVRTLDNGKRVRVNKQTGEVIADSWS